MSKRTAILATILAVGALAAVPFVYAGPGGGHRGFGGHHEGFGAGMFFGHLQHLQDELDLSDAQMDQIKAIFTEVHQQNEAYRDQLHGGLHAAALTLLNNPNDLAAAQAQLESQAAAEKAMKQNFLAATSKAINVLTAEQRSKLAEIIQERSERRERRSR